jgi:hypothetical protein
VVQSMEFFWQSHDPMGQFGLPIIMGATAQDEQSSATPPRGGLPHLCIKGVATRGNQDIVAEADRPRVWQHEGKRPQIVQALQALDVEVEVDASKLVQNEVAYDVCGK